MTPPFESDEKSSGTSALDRGVREPHQRRGDLLQSLASELATPLTPLVGYLKLLRDGRLGELSSKQRQVVDAMVISVDRLRHAVDELADFAAFEAGLLAVDVRKLDLVSLATRAIEAADDHARSRHVRVELHAPAQLEASGDAEKLSQALASILHNAIRFSPHGGQVLVRVARVGDGLLMDVFDQGPGLGDGRLDGLPTKRADQLVGTGLGLSLARRIAEVHGGQLVLESPPKEQPGFRGLFCGSRIGIGWPGR